MSKIFTLDEVVSSLEDMLETGGEVSVTANGNEMLPIIRDKRDTVTYVKKGEKLSKNDTVLYLTEAGSCVLRRIVYVNGNTYVLSGDNETGNDYKITHERIIGVMTSYDRKGKTHKVTDKSYRLYVLLLPIIKPVLYGYKWLRKRVVDFIKFLFKR